MLRLTLYFCLKQKITEPKYFDFIVVGAGTAGCVIGNRLTENDWNVSISPSQNIYY